jgi:hypothetical protein
MPRKKRIIYLFHPFGLASLPLFNGIALLGPLPDHFTL